MDCRNAGIFKYSYYEVRYSLRATIKSLGMLIQGKATKDDISGPIGVAQVIGEVKEQAEPYGIWVVILNMINIALLLSVNLGVMNLLPLPALDGGRLVFLIIEAIRGKPVPPEREGMVHFAGFVVLMILMVFVMFNDISRFFR
ncbi:site-2 protease family protein [Eisenbergiella massiliensis]|uniref:site-2 protease family protein n=1 Tax=Eisenbergiella massiliensis TaxID=1720294 RepID=UPI002F41E68F